MKNNKKTQVKSKEADNRTTKTSGSEKFKREFILAEITYQHELEVRLRKEAVDLHFEVDSEEQIWAYKDSKVVADIYIEEEWDNKINALIDINPYSKVTFKKVEKKLRDFLFNEWSREQYEKLEISESCLSKDPENWKDSQ
ncbi:hypothetical protein [Chryseobacterium sp. JK1]|uniref:hypothetical protein n=1 Tax=Chryseobacterium sp. JK1 TaxID=874294 RepID=UPI003D68FF8C